MILSLEQLERIIPNNKYTEDWFNALVDTLPQYGIDTLERISAFLSQCSHESCEFTILKENLNYRWQSLRKTFPKYFPTDALAKEYEHNQEMIASRVYANRMGNGDEDSGDGWKFCGRGIIQITGHDNCQAFAESVGKDIEEIPDYLMSFDGAIQSACWYWDVNNLNKFADTENIKGLTKAINGGFNGLEDRIQKYNNIKEILSS